MGGGGIEEVKEGGREKGEECGNNFNSRKKDTL